MKRLLLILILTLSFQSCTKADDISDFEIEGISIGDSLLDHFSKAVIKKNIMWHYNDDRKNKNFVTVEFYNLTSAETYHGIQLAIKPDDKSYKVYLISGAILYENNIKDCYLKMNDIEEELSKLFKSANKQKTMNSINKTDKSGKSTYSGIYYYFSDGGNASVQCYDNSDDYESDDNLRVSIRTSEYREWYFSSRK